MEATVPVLKYWRFLNSRSKALVIINHPYSLIAQTIKNPPAMQETWVWSLDQEDPLEKEMATHSSLLAWRIPGTGEPDGLPSMGLHGVGHDWSDLAAAAARQPCFLGGSDGKESTCSAGDLGLIPGSGRSSGEGNDYPLQVFLPGEFHEQRSLAGYSPWDCKESDMAEQLTFSLYSLHCWSILMLLLLALPSGPDLCILLHETPWL